MTTTHAGAPRRVVGRWLSKGFGNQQSTDPYTNAVDKISTGDRTIHAKIARFAGFAHLILLPDLSSLHERVQQCVRVRITPGGRMKTTLFALATCLVAVGLHAETNDAGTWNSKGAAAYLDQRSSWWITWQPAARDHDTFCISCHTALPYALGRPALRAALNEQGPSANEQQLLDNVKKRVRLWSEVLPFYNDEKNGAPKTAEARGTEVVLNALILASYDARDGKLSDDARLALDNMWGLQLKTGERKGAWTWLNFHNEPWEADDSQFWGATLGALAAGNTPKDYRSTPAVQENLKLLTGYLQHEQAEQSLINRTFLLWASTKLPDLLTAKQQKSIVDELLS